MLQVVSNVMTVQLENRTEDRSSSYAMIDQDDAKDAEELSRNIVNQVLNLGSAVAANRIVGEKAVIVETSQITLLASKTLLRDVGSDVSSLVFGDIGFELGSDFGNKLTDVSNSSEVLRTFYRFNSNPYYYSSSSSRVNTKMAGLELRTTGNEEIKVDDLPDDSQILIRLPRSVDVNFSTTEATVVSNNYTFLRFNFSELWSDGAVSIEVTLLGSHRMADNGIRDKSEETTSEPEAVAVYFMQHEGPTDSDVTEEYNRFNLTLDMFTNKLNITHKDYTIFLLAG